MVGNSRNKDNQSVSLSQEEVQFISGLNADNGIGANDWIQLCFASNFNRGSIPSMKSVVEKNSLQKGISLDRIQYIA